MRDDVTRIADVSINSLVERDRPFEMEDFEWGCSSPWGGIGGEGSGKEHSFISTFSRCFYLFFLFFFRTTIRTHCQVSRASPLKHAVLPLMTA